MNSQFQVTYAVIIQPVLQAWIPTLGLYGNTSHNYMLVETENASIKDNTFVNIFRLCFVVIEPFHPGLAENIAPDGGPGSDIIVVRL